MWGVGGLGFGRRVYDLVFAPASNFDELAAGETAQSKEGQEDEGHPAVVDEWRLGQGGGRGGRECEFAGWREGGGGGERT